MRTRLVILGVAIAIFPAGGASSGIDPETRFTPVAAAVLTDPAAVKASDNAYHIAYELLLTNATPQPIDVTTLEVRDGKSHRVLLTLTSSDLVSQMNPIGTMPEDESGSTSIPSSGVSIVWLDVTIPPKTSLPLALEHRIVGSIGGPRSVAATPFEAVVARIPTSTAKPLVLGPPVGPGTWLASEGCCADITHHRRGLAPVNGQLLVPQRFALDFFLLDGEDRAWVADPTRLDSYVSYRQQIFAAADGTVVDAEDGLPDQQPPPSRLPSHRSPRLSATT